MRARALICALAAAAAAAATGCGGSSAGESSTSTAAGPPSRDRSFGVHSDQPEGRSHLGRKDCLRLDRLVEAHTGRSLRRSSDPSPPLSRCRLTGRGVRVTIYLDAAYAARQRYDNRMVEQVQFNAPDPARLPHPVAGVGDRSAGDHYASWIPAYRSLFAVRGNRFLTVAYSVQGHSRASSEAGAVAVARRGFRLSARNQ